LANRRLLFRTRLGPLLETGIGNAMPIIEVFRDCEYDAPIDWERARRIIDVGGHVGAFTTWASARAPEARIVVFEPDPRNFDDLERNVERNRLGPRVVLINAAVGRADGRRAFHVSTEGYVSSFTPRTGTKTTEVDCISLERYLLEQSPSPIDVLKLDCEGAEWEILKTLRAESLRRVRYLFVECHAQDTKDVDAMMRLLADRGFLPRIRTMGPGGSTYRIVAVIWAERSETGRQKADVSV